MIRGLAVALLASFAGLGIHLLLPAVPWLTASLVLGVLASIVARRFVDGPLKPGLAIASRRLLRLGIVLLGLSLSLTSIAALGWFAIVGIVVLVALAFGVTYAVARLLRLEGDQPMLLAAGFSICGVSAVGAFASARGTEKDAATPVTLVTLFGTAAIVVLPLLAGAIGLDVTDFGRLTGASVHDVGQVVATAQTAGAVALAAAVVVKLTRVLLLAPMVAIASLAARRPGVKNPPVVPLFIVGFLALVLVRTLLPVPDLVLDVVAYAQSALLAAALFAIGASLRLEQLVRSGGRALAAGAISWAIIVGLALGFVALT